MKNTILIFFLLLPMSVFSQGYRADTITKWDRNTQTEEYVMVLATSRFLTTKVNITLDYGQSTKFFSDNRVKDETGRVIYFNSVVDALNYMNSQRWEFVNAYVITVSNQNIYHYLMRRKVIKP